MRWIEGIFTYALFIAGCAAAQTAQTYLYLHQPVDLRVCLLVGLLTLLSYNGYRLLGIWQQQGFRAMLQPNRLLLVCLTIVSGATLFLLVEWQMVHSILILGMVCTIVYSLPLWPIPAMQSLHRFGFAKTLLLSFTWTLVLHAWPFGTLREAFQFPYYWYFIGRFCFLLLLCILFDARDVRVDRERSFRSLATDLPVYWMHILSLLAVLGFGFAMHQFLRTEPVAHQYPVVIGTVLALAVLYRMSFRQRGYYFYYFGVDGMLLLNALASFLVIG